MFKSNLSAKKSTRFVLFTCLFLAIGLVFAAQLSSVKSEAENAGDFSNLITETQTSKSKQASKQASKQILFLTNLS